MKRFILIFLAFSMILPGCSVRVPQNDLAPSVREFPSTAVTEVANLPTLDISSIHNYEQFKTFIDAINALSKTLNEKSDGMFKIPEIDDVSLETFQKASGLITEYGPLIQNYNDVVLAARQVNQGESDISDFYKKAAVFGIEVAVISTGLFYSPAFETTGILYRASGLNRLAFDYPDVVRFILQNAHWTIRTALVEQSSEAFDQILNEMEKAHNLLDLSTVNNTVESIKNRFNGK